MINLLIATFITNLSYYLVGKTFFKGNIVNEKRNIAETLINGFIIISFISLLINFFFPLTKILTTGFFLFFLIYFFIKKERFNKKEVNFLLYTSLFIISFIIYDNVNRPDAMIYHLPFSKILNEEKILIGLSNIHFRFGHVSILQYTSSFNVNYFTGDVGVLIPLASIYILIIFYIINELFISLKSQNFNYTTIFLVLILFFITYKINRYSKLGNDDIGHLMAFILIYKFITIKNINFTNFKEITLLAVFTTTNKFSLIFFAIFPLVFLLNNKKKFIRIFFSFPALFLALWLIKNILISGCVLFPIKQTCFESLSWTNIKQIESEEVSGEAWSKDWPNYSDQKADMKIYISKFNWLDTWLNNHFKKILLNLLPLSIFIFTVFLYLRNQKKYKTNITTSDMRQLYIALTITALGILIFFIKFPLYRYGYSYMAAFITLFGAVYIDTRNKKKISKLINFVLMFSFIIILGKQFLRYYNYYETRSLIPRIVDKDLQLEKIYLSKNFKYYLNRNSQNCWYNVPVCTYIITNNIEVKNFFTYKIIKPKNN